jgi:ubiquinone/menaquinone biosynthesis C-methylase UbiE
MNQENFWNDNPCGGDWSEFGEKVSWLLEKEPHIKDLIRDDLFLNKKVLDVGSGQGTILSLIAKKAEKAVGIDLSKESLKKAGQGIFQLKLNNVELIEMNAENLKFEDNSFDTVFSHGVLHHTKNTQRGIDEIRRVLKKDGRAVIMLYRKWCPKGIGVLAARAFSRGVDAVTGKNFYIASKLKKNPEQGTALFELFGCPILKTYSKRQIKKMFSQFKNVKIYFKAPGFLRLGDFIFKNSRPVKRIFKALDRADWLGFYILIEAEK